MNRIRHGLSAVLTRYFSGESISYQAVFALLLPVVVDQFFLIGFNFINTAMISSSGQAAISAVNIVGSLNILLVQVFVSIGLGGTVLMAQYYGRGSHSMLGEVCNGSLYGTVIVAIIVAVTLVLFHNPILHLLFGPASALVMTNARLYIVGIMFSYPAEAVIESTNGCLRGIGRTKISLQLSLMMNSIYLAFNFLFVTALNYGVVGLAISLNISRWCIAGFAIFTLYRERSLFSLSFKTLKHANLFMIKRVLTVSVPFAAESVFFNGGKVIMQMMIVTLGTSVVAANAIAGSWIQLSEIIPTALGTSLVPIVGQCIGRKNMKDARKLTRSFVGLGSILFILVDLTLLPLYPIGIQLFHPSKAIISLVFQIFIVALVMHFLSWSVSFVLPSALRAAGDAKFTTIVSLLSMWCFRIGGGYVVGIVLSYGLIGIFVVMCLEWSLRGTIFILRFKGQRWLQHNLI